MSYDLSSDLSEGYEGMGPVLSKILHTATPLVAGKFIRTQGQTQGLTVLDMLNSGVRFIDFRIMYSDAPGAVWPRKDWYCLHGCQSRRPALAYLKEIRAWLDAHPREVVVFWVSRHGNAFLSGTDQYPSTTPAERMAFYSQVEEVFRGKLFNASRGRLNETSVATLWSRGQQVIWYAADYAQSTNSSELAMDARLVDNRLPGPGPAFDALTLFRNGSAARAASKAKNHFMLVSLAASAPTKQIENAAKLTFLPLLPRSRESLEQECAASLGIPGITRWCPMHLLDLSQLHNYYNQLILDATYNEGATNAAVDFPNAIYIDAVDVGGRIRTGTQLLNPSSQDATSELPDGIGAGASGFAYSATLVAATLRRLCRRLAGGAAVTGTTTAAAEGCSAMMRGAQAARQLAPVLLWNDTAHGRWTNWPPLPPPREVTPREQLMVV